MVIGLDFLSHHKVSSVESGDNYVMFEYVMYDKMWKYPKTSDFTDKGQ